MTVFYIFKPNDICSEVCCETLGAFRNKTDHQPRRPQRIAKNKFGGGGGDLRSTYYPFSEWQGYELAKDDDTPDCDIL